jgi:pimeloyl-ACP methyl ester carboxylesterase
VLDPLMDQNELIAYSLPGHPGTPLPGHQYGVPELTEQLRQVAVREGLAKFHLIGISLGGSVAQHFAGTYPEMVDKLVLMDCSPRYDDDSRANWPVRAAAARKDGVKSLIPMLLQVFFTAESIAENGPNVRHVRETFEACDGEGYALACEALATLDAREQTRKVTAETLIMLGSNERQSFKDAAKWMHETITGSRLVEVPHAGHASVRERPEFVVQQLQKFLN